MDERKFKEAMENGVFKLEVENCQPRYRCTICKVFLNGPLTCSVHLLGKNHIKRCNLMALAKSSPCVSESSGTEEAVKWLKTQDKELSQLVDDGIMETFQTDSGALHFSCQVCGTAMSGIVPAKSHFRSAKHIKKLQKHDISISFHEKLSLLSSPEQVSTPVSNHLSKISKDKCLEEKDDHSTLYLKVRQSLAQGTLVQSTYRGKKVFTCLPCSAAVTGENAVLAHFFEYSHELNMSTSSTSIPSSSFPPQLDGNTKDLIRNLNSLSHLIARDTYAEGNNKKNSLIEK